MAPPTPSRRPTTPVNKLRRVSGSSSRAPAACPGASEAARAIGEAKRVLVVTGAGISVSGGIPDFRSSTGLYALVKARFPQSFARSGKDIFDAHLFRDPESTRAFYCFMSELKLLTDRAQTTPVHTLIRDLDERGSLLRCYTQNIDDLEARLGFQTDLALAETERGFGAASLTRSGVRLTGGVLGAAAENATTTEATDSATVQALTHGDDRVALSEYLEPTMQAQLSAISPSMGPLTPSPSSLGSLSANSITSTPSTNAHRFSALLASPGTPSPKTRPSPGTTSQAPPTPLGTEYQLPTSNMTSSNSHSASFPLPPRPLPFLQAKSLGPPPPSSPAPSLLPTPETPTHVGQLCDIYKNVVFDDVQDDEKNMVAFTDKQAPEVFGFSCEMPHEEQDASDNVESDTACGSGSGFAATMVPDCCCTVDCGVQSSPNAAGTPCISCRTSQGTSISDKNSHQLGPTLSQHSVTISGPCTTPTTTRHPLRIVQLHGTLSHLICVLCRHRYPYNSTFLATTAQGDPPSCPNCEKEREERKIAGKRERKTGWLRPDIVLYNEVHERGDLIAHLTTVDLRRRPDLLLVMGTSLKIPGVRRLVRDAARAVHSVRGGVAILVNKTAPGKEWEDVFDHVVVGDADGVAEEVRIWWREKDQKEGSVESGKEGKENVRLRGSCDNDKSLGELFAAIESDLTPSVESGRSAATVDVKVVAAQVDHLSNLEESPTKKQKTLQSILPVAPAASRITAGRTFPPVVRRSGDEKQPAHQGVAMSAPQGQGNLMSAFKVVKWAAQYDSSLSIPLWQAFARFLQSLAKFGDHVVLEAKPSKPILNIFKQKTNVEKNVEKLVIKLNSRDMVDRLVLQIYCKYGIIKTHKLHYEAASLFQAIYSTVTCRNQFVASPKVINEWLVNFHQKLDEVTVMCTATTLKLRSFTEGSQGDTDVLKRSLQTELSIDPTDFDAFLISFDVNLTVKLKELKAILSFADSMSQGVTAYFEHSGQPLTFRVQSGDNYTADFVLATIDDSPPHVMQEDPKQHITVTAPAKLAASVARPSTPFQPRQGQQLVRQSIKPIVEDHNLGSRISNRESEHGDGANERGASQTLRDADINIPPTNEFKRQTELSHTSHPPSSFHVPPTSETAPTFVALPTFESPPRNSFARTTSDRDVRIRTWGDKPEKVMTGYNDLGNPRDESDEDEEAVAPSPPRAKKQSRLMYADE
ncbi:hypothetical protein HDU93_007897 [Gonapodya sp. JEL0774]|nr:hypothetical protein HDU93_007897 [Gonapodya sp. JEL0774]